MVDPTVLIISNLATAAISAAGAGGIVAWRKSGPESEAIAVKTLRSVVEELRAELKRKQEEIEFLRARVDSLSDQVEAIASEPPSHLG